MADRFYSNSRNFVCSKHPKSEKIEWCGVYDGAKPSYECKACNEEIFPSYKWRPGDPGPEDFGGSDF